MTTEPLLALRQVGHSFGGLAVLRSVTFDVPEGGIVGLIGPNGSGKTTLFNIVSGYIRPLAGTVAYRGASIARNSIQQRGLAGLVRTFQTPQVFEQMTVLENIMVGCTKLTRTNMLQDLLRTPAARGQMQEIRRRAEAACERFRLGALSDLPAASLTVWDSVSSHFTLGLMFWAAIIFTPIIILYTSWCYRVMRGKVTVEHIRANEHSAY